MKKCVCGYEHKEQWELENELGNKSEAEAAFYKQEEFIEVIGTFMVNTKRSWGNDEVRAYLYACPKCNTVQLSKG